MLTSSQNTPDATKNIPDATQNIPNATRNILDETHNIYPILINRITISNKQIPKIDYF